MLPAERSSMKVYMFIYYMYDSTLSSPSIDHIYVAFCAYISPKVCFRSYTIPMPVLLYYPFRAGNIACFMSRILFRPQLLPRVYVTSTVSSTTLT